MCAGLASIYPLSGLIDYPFPCFVCYTQVILFVNISSSDFKFVWCVTRSVQVPCVISQQWHYSSGDLYHHRNVLTEKGFVFWKLSVEWIGRGQSPIWGQCSKHNSQFVSLSSTFLTKSSPNIPVYTETSCASLTSGSNCHHVTCREFICLGCHVVTVSLGYVAGFSLSLLCLLQLL
jgi:hypothetical protein